MGIAADHAGLELKREIAAHLRGGGHRVRDYGTDSADAVDYPAFVVTLAAALTGGEIERAIFCCGSGVGPAVAANKVRGVRAAVVSEEWSARDAVEHVDVNFLTLGQRVLGGELAKSIVDSFLGATAQGGRHARRRRQIAELESGR